jgi:amino acid adenylation domain-containing protein
MSIEHTFGLSSLQQGMLFNHLHGRVAGVDIEQIVCTMRHPVDLEPLADAWSAVLARHEALRTSFQWAGVDAPVQHVHERTELTCSVRDVRGYPPQLQRRVVDEYIASDRVRPFCLMTPPLMRCAIFRSADAHTLVWTFPHLLMDGRSFPIVLQDLFSAWGARLGAGGLQPAPSQHRHFIGWLAGRDTAADEVFWRSRLAGLASPTLLASASSAADSAAERGADELRLPAAVTRALQDVAARGGVSLGTLVQGAWGILLARYLGHGDVVFGATRAGRHDTIPSAESAVGMFINTLPVRAAVEDHLPVGSWLAALHAREREVRPHVHAALADVQRWSGQPHGAALFDSLLVFDRQTLGNRMSQLGDEWNRREVHLLERTSYPLTVYGYGETELLLRLASDRPAFPEAVTVRMLRHLATLLTGIAAEPHRTVGALPMLTSEERRAHAGWNSTSAAWRRDACAHELIDEQVARTPTAEAVVCGTSVLTYAELDLRASALARQLREAGAGPESLVGIAMERSIEFVVAALAAWKAGAAWLPLDPAYPAARLAFIIEDAQPTVLVSTRGVLERLAVTGLPTIVLDAGAEVESVSHGSDATARPAAPHHLAYVIYTSGSTGRPKGVMVEHRNLVSFFGAMDGLVPDSGQQRCWLAVSSPSFDISILEMFWTLTRGFRVVLYRGNLGQAQSRNGADGEPIDVLMRRHGVTHLQCTPSLAALLMADPASRTALAPLHALLVGGEPLPAPLAHDLMSAVRGVVMNMYGPTETTIWSSTHRLSPADVRIPVGRPISNTHFHILAPGGEPVPVGVTGELFIGGAGVARGYLRRPELTAARFSASAAGDGVRLYRTGDLARYREDGVVELMGRMDDQVKIRGHRIELGEIEVALREQPGVREAAVIVASEASGDVRLIAYVVANGTSTDAVRRGLAEQLPAALMPSAIIPLARLPLLPSGKVDRSALPLPGSQDVAAGATHVAPASELERTIAGIWEEVLVLPRVSVVENFFDLGGHSLMTLQVYGRLRRDDRHELSLIDLFRFPTVRALAEHLDSARAVTATLPESRSRADARRLWRAQQSLT